MKQKNILDVITMKQDDVTVINGGKIATGTIAANMLAITDLNQLKQPDGTTKTLLSGWMLDTDKIVGVYSSLSTVLRVPKSINDVRFSGRRYC